MGTEGDLTLYEHRMQYTDDVLQNCILETYVVLLTHQLKLQIYILLSLLLFFADLKIFLFIQSTLLVCILPVENYFS